jgi:signal transduction histidine kinase
MFHSYRAKLQTAFLTLGLAAIALTGWEASSRATEALRQATQDRLTAIRQTRARQLERYFQDLGAHVLALSGDESTVAALADFTRATLVTPPARPDGPAARQLRAFHRQTLGTEAWFPQDPRTIALQHLFHPEAPSATAGPYAQAHARHHPTLSRYKNAFGFYDVFLIDAASARVVYTVLKEVDFAVPLLAPPYRDSALAKVYRQSLAFTEPERYVIQDYEPYVPSHSQPAAFVASPIWDGRTRTGILAMQISTEEVNRVVSADGEGARVYLAVAGPPPPDAHVLRSQSQLAIPGLHWTLVAEIAEHEAFAPARALRNRILGLGAVIAAAFLIVAALLARSVTRPVLELVEGTRRLGRRDFSARLQVSSADEIGQLAESFNRMAEDLARTTVSKAELEKLAGKLITAQEDERRRIARELHDDLTQRLAAVAIEAGRLEKLPEPGRALQRIKDQMSALAHDVARLARSLHPAMLEELGLLAAIQSECRASFERGGPPVEFHAPDHVSGLSSQTQLTIYRIVQEALNNIRKHAQAESVSIRLTLEGGEAHLEVEDDGVGFDRAGPGWRPGLGIASMEERARLAGGRFEIRSAPQRGTYIGVRLPVA